MKTENIQELYIERVFILSLLLIGSAVTVVIWLHYNLIYTLIAIIIISYLLYKIIDAPAKATELYVTVFWRFHSMPKMVPEDWYVLEEIADNNRVYILSLYADFKSINRFQASIVLRRFGVKTKFETIWECINNIEQHRNLIRKW